MYVNVTNFILLRAYKLQFYKFCPRQDSLQQHCGKNLSQKKNKINENMFFLSIICCI